MIRTREQEIKRRRKRRREQLRKRGVFKTKPTSVVKPAESELTATSPAS